ncbi:hypothetical protein T12_6108 [Trichinella patagoniensis]|uniref:Uncharacterized protein n=1 Tax=Trichinella patagoniensis TaxID=990121 RepID=A0A0V0ZFV1_9BILA|nr:hypothetical protein T12_6108 [Trichinella patagoniensis]
MGCVSSKALKTQSRTYRGAVEEDALAETSLGMSNMACINSTGSTGLSNNGNCVYNGKTPWSKNSGTGGPYRNHERNVQHALYLLYRVFHLELLDPVMWQWLLVQLKKSVASNLSTSSEEDNLLSLFFSLPVLVNLIKDILCCLKQVSNREVESEFFCEDGDIEGATVRNHTQKKWQRVSTAQSNNNNLELLEYHVHAGGTVVAYMPAHHVVTLPLPLERSVPRPPTLVVPHKIIEASAFMACKYMCLADSMVSVMVQRNSFDPNLIFILYHTVDTIMFMTLRCVSVVFRVALPTKMDANKPEAISVGSLRNDSPKNTIPLCDHFAVADAEVANSLLEPVNPQYILSAIAWNRLVLPQCYVMVYVRKLQQHTLGRRHPQED